MVLDHRRRSASRRIQSGVPMASRRPPRPHARGVLVHSPPAGLLEEVVRTAEPLRVRRRRLAPGGVRGDVVDLADTALAPRSGAEVVGRATIRATVSGNRLRRGSTSTTRWPSVVVKNRRTHERPDVASARASPAGTGPYPWSTAEASSAPNSVSGRISTPTSTPTGASPDVTGAPLSASTARSHASCAIVRGSPSLRRADASASSRCHTPTSCAAGAQIDNVAIASRSRRRCTWRSSRARTVRSYAACGSRSRTSRRAAAAARFGPSVLSCGASSRSTSARVNGSR